MSGSWTADMNQSFTSRESDTIRCQCQGKIAKFNRFKEVDIPFL